MALHLVGETIDKTRSHYQAETGKLVQLMRGVYVGADDDIDATVLKHAVRIAKYLYPRAYLSAAGAVLSRADSIIGRPPPPPRTPKSKTTHVRR